MSAATQFLIAPEAARSSTQGPLGRNVPANDGEPFPVWRVGIKTGVFFWNLCAGSGVLRGATNILLLFTHERRIFPVRRFSFYLQPTPFILHSGRAPIATLTGIELEAEAPLR